MQIHRTRHPGYQNNRSRCPRCDDLDLSRGYCQGPDTGQPRARESPGSQDPRPQAKKNGPRGWGPNKEEDSQVLAPLARR